MVRWIALTFCLFVSLAAAPVDFTVHTGYFERNDSGLKGPVSYLVLESRESFDRLFGVGFTMGPKPKVVPEDAFESKLVVAVIKRGGEVWEYKVEGVTEEKGVLTLRYAATSRDGRGAQFASPLIVSVPKGSFREVVFVEGGKDVGKADRKPRS